MNEETNLNFLLGQLSGQVGTLSTQVASMAGIIAGLDERLRKNETNTTSLMVKMSFIGFIGGGVGTLVVGLIEKLITK